MNTNPQSQLPSPSHLEVFFEEMGVTIIACIERLGKLRPRSGSLGALLFVVATCSMLLADVPEPTRETIDQIIGSKGTYIADGGVYRVVLPRPEATIVLDYQHLSPAVGLNS